MKQKTKLLSLRERIFLPTIVFGSTFGKYEANEVGSGPMKVQPLMFVTPLLQEPRYKSVACAVAKFCLAELRAVC